MGTAYRRYPRASAPLQGRDPHHHGIAGGAAAGLVANAVLADGSRWDATLVTSRPDGTEIGRQRFVFALDAEGLSEGRATPPTDPGLLLAMIMLCLGVVGLAFGLSGGALPRTMRETSLLALVGASTVGAVLGLAIIVVGGPH